MTSQIPPNAVIVTADVDAFVMTPRILLPIKKLPDKKIWIYRYAFTHTAGALVAVTHWYCNYYVLCLLNTVVVVILLVVVQIYYE